MMSRATTAAPAAAARTELLARLGLASGADDRSIEEAHEQIVRFLEGAPDDIKPWADRRQREADRVFSLLTGPESELVHAASRLAPATGKASGARRPLPKPVMWLIGFAAGLGLIFGVYQLGKPPATPTMTGAQGAPSAAPAAVDQAKVSELMGKIQANPQDTESLMALAGLYMNARDYANADTFFHKILAYDPGNERALIGSGVAAFNAGNVTEAEAHLAKAVELHPGNAEAHYNLGFVYMTTQRMDLMKAEWAKVVELAPDSTMAQNVQQHVGAVKGHPSPEPSK